ncbi:MAG: helix-turn-helix domain-containing protein, partial [Armatimonadetes bacterium]|nr:helix-turn-helix domain-containing protein [Anaerolineae bacterium]
MDTYSLGQQLRAAREAKEITLLNAETALKIRQQVLENFEQGDFNVAGASPVQVRGFIRNYARYIGLDEERTLLSYDAALQPNNRRRRADQRSSQTAPQVNARPKTEPRPATPSYRDTQEARRRPSPTRRLLSLLLLILLGLGALTIIAFVTQQLITTPPETVFIEDGERANSDLIADLPPSLTFTPTATQTPGRTPTLLPRTFQDYAGQPVLVTLEVRQRCWLRFEADGVEVFAGLVAPDEQFVIEYAANTEIIINASNAAALVVTYNGQPQLSFG